MRQSQATRWQTWLRTRDSARSILWRVGATAAVATALTLTPVAPAVQIVFAQDAIALPPVAPSLATPSDGTTIENAWGEVVLQWEAVPGAVDYQVVLNDGERTGPWVAETTWAPGSLPEGTYRWTVIARNDAGTSELGGTYTFTIAPSSGDAAGVSATSENLDPLPFQLQQPVAEVADPAEAPGAEAIDKFLRFQSSVDLEQQDADDAMAGSVGESGTVNGEPRDTGEPAPAETVNPAAPGNVTLPPSVPGVPSALNPNVPSAIASTTEMVFNAVADTTIFGAAPGAPQSPESISFLAIGGPNEAIALMSFEVSGIGGGTVLGARLAFYGAGVDGAPGGSVLLIPDFVAWDGLTANGTPEGYSALSVHGTPSWFERVEPSGLTAVDVTGTVTGDGTYTFALPGQREQTGSIYAIESGSPAQLILTVGLPA
jgi:hypothetical protein